MGRALAPLFALLTVPGVVASALLRRAVYALALPSVERLEGGGDLPYPGLVASTVGPFVALTAGAVAAFAASTAAGVDGSAELALIWLGLSLSVHAFPSEGATAALYSHSFGSESRWRWLGAPLAAISGPVAELRKVWLDLVYGVGLYALVRAGLGLL